MKGFVSADVHSFYDEWMDALEEKGFEIDNPEHHIILCGDLLDRGTQPRECLRFANQLIKQNRIICILGNHEDLMGDLIRYRGPGEHDYHNGTKQTIDYLIDGENLIFSEKCDLMKKDSDWMTYYEECLKRFYYETDHYIFTHSGVPYDFDSFEPLEDGRNTKDSFILSEGRHSAIWANPFLMGERNGKKGIDGKTIVCGHGHTSGAYREYQGYDKDYLERVETMWMDSEGIIHPTCCYDIFEANGIIGLDACTVKSHQVNVLVLEEL